MVQRAGEALGGRPGQVGRQLAGWQVSQLATPELLQLGAARPGQPVTLPGRVVGELDRQPGRWRAASPVAVCQLDSVC